MNASMWGNQSTQLFYSLSPDHILNSIEKYGLRTTGRCLPLNSMENRVYEIELDSFEYEGQPLKSVIAKFYRPGRWGLEQIQEEHQFLNQLHENDVEVNAPIKLEGQSIFPIEELNIYMSLFQKIGGRNEVELNDEQVQKLARLLGRVHLSGKSHKAKHRLKLDVTTYGEGSLHILSQDQNIPPMYREHYIESAKKILQQIEPLFKNVKVQRIHGDCHLGNVLWNYEDRPILVDFDDMVTGPIIQDFWLLFDWRDSHLKELFIDAYEEFSEFPYSQLKLIEALRTLRMIHFNAWISKRWEDPSFQMAFPHFHREEFWSTQSADLRQQEQLLQNQSVSIF